MALRLGEYAVTEAGFGADLGAEKFINIKCRTMGLKPSAVVLVASIRALKYHGGAAKANLENENLSALEKGLPNMFRHYNNIMTSFGLPAVVALNRFPTDTEAEHAFIIEKCNALGVKIVLSEVWGKGGEGGIALAKEVARLCDEPSQPCFTYSLEASIVDKLNAIVTGIYHGDGVELTPSAKKQAKELTALGFENLPICMAKTQYSFSDNQNLRGAPSGFKVKISNLKVSAGAGFIVAQTGDIMTMPGLPQIPSAEIIDIDSSGIISGLF
jgi:formate--tetrahydrofolate ligase